MHVKRLLTAVIGLPILIGLVAEGSAPLFALLVGCASILALHEYYIITLGPPGPQTRGGIPLAGYGAAAGVIGAAAAGSFAGMTAALALNLLAVGLLSLLQVRTDPKVPEVAFRQVLGVIYLSVLPAYLVLIRNGSQGVGWTFFLFSVVFAGDAAAFYAGTLLGRHKLMPVVSPGKTREGAVAGLLGNIGAGLACRGVLDLAVGWEICILLSVLMGAAAQAGDLFESQLKRGAGVKDSGRILPGHGGILDRIDASLFAAPVLFYFKDFVLGG